MVRADAVTLGKGSDIVASGACPGSVGPGLQVTRKWPLSQCCMESPVHASGDSTSKSCGHDSTPGLSASWLSPLKISHASCFLVLMVSLVQGCLWPVPEHCCIALPSPFLPQPQGLTQLPLCSRISSLPSLRPQMAPS